MVTNQITMIVDRSKAQTDSVFCFPTTLGADECRSVPTADDGIVFFCFVKIILFIVRRQKEGINNTATEGILEEKKTY